MKKLLPTLFTLSFLFMLFLFLPSRLSHAQLETDSPCITEPINFGVEKRLLPLPANCPATNTTEGKFCGRGEHSSGTYAPSPQCATPTHIVMHTTKGITSAAGIFDFFATGGGGNGTGSHFVIGQDGAIIQMVEMDGTQVEYAQAVGPFDEHISIEMGSPPGFIDGNYSSKQDMITRGSQDQYDNSLKLVKTLMQQYNIPIENVVSHKSLGGGAGDPGDGWMTDFINDLPSAQPLSGTSSQNTPPVGSTVSTTNTSCLITKVGDPTDPAPTLPAECRGGSSGGGLGGIPTAGDYNLPMNRDVITGITTEMGTYGGNGAWGGHTEHAGLDINVENGTGPAVYSVTNGTVEGIYAGGEEIDPSLCADTNGEGAGNEAGCTVKIVHDGDSLTSWYTHIRPSVSVGQHVDKGDQIGVIHIWSSPNDHLHLELRETSTNQNVQPRNYFPDLQIIPVSDSYNGDIRAHSASRGIELLNDGKEFAERFRYHPPCLNEPSVGWCWAY